MKESKGVYVTRRLIKNDRKLIYQLYTECDNAYRQGRRADQSCQFDSKRDACTCRIHRKPDYFSHLPKQIYATYGRSITEIGVGSVKALHRRRVKRIYLPATDERGVGSSDLSSVISKEKKYLTSYYDTKKTSSKCVGGILEYNTRCAVSEKCSPILSTKSGSTSPKSAVQLENIEIGSNTIEKNFLTVSTQFECIKLPSKTKKSTIDTTTSEGNMHKSLMNIKYNKIKTMDMKMKEEEEKFSSDSLVQHVYNLELPSEEKPSKSSLDPMENKLEREYRKIFATKSKVSSNQSDEKSVPEYKSASFLRRRFQALRRGLIKKDEMKKGSFGQKSSSHDSNASRKDASVTSDPPSLVEKSYSGTNKKYSPILAHPVEQERVSPFNTDSLLSELDIEQGVKGMFKLWGKRFNLDEEYQNQIKAPPVPSYKTLTPSVKQIKSNRSSKISEKTPRNQIVIKDSNIVKQQPSVNKKNTSKEKTSKDKEIKKEKRFFFFKKKKKSETKQGPKAHYHESTSKKPENVTAGRCEVKEGFNIKVGKPANESLKTAASKTSEETDEITKKRWLRRFLSGTIESARSVNIRWNNVMYGASSSTVFELIDTVYRNTDLFITSRSETTSFESNYRTNTKHKVNFVQDIEAWMVPKTIPYKQFQEIPKNTNSEKNIPNKIQLSVSNQRWVIEKKSMPHKIEVVLRSRNLKPNTQVSAEYLRIDIPKDFFDSTTSEESKRNQTSDEEVYKIVEYESDCEQKTASKLIKVQSSENGNVKSDIKVIVNVKDSDHIESRILETVIKRPPIHRDVVIQGSNVNIPKRFDVIGVGIITQRDLRDKRKSLITIKPLSSNDSIDRTPLIKQKKCEFAESYLREYYRHWTPFGVDLLSCVSDSHLKSSSENSSTSHNHQGDGSKSCPNIYDDYRISALLSSSSSSVSPPSRLLAHQGNSCSCIFFSNSKKSKAVDLDENSGKRCLPKDSLEVFKKRKLYAQSMKHSWICADDKPVSVPSFESKCEQDACSECPGKVDNAARCPPIKKKRVSLPDCATDGGRISTPVSQPSKPEGILSFKSSSSKSPKHASILPDPIHIDSETPSCEACATSVSCHFIDSTSAAISPVLSPQDYPCESPMTNSQPTVCHRLPSNVEHQPRKAPPRSRSSTPSHPKSNVNTSLSIKCNSPQLHPADVQCPSIASSPKCPSPPELLSSGSFCVSPSSRPLSPHTDSSQVCLCINSNKKKKKPSGSPHQDSSKSSSLISLDYYLQQNTYAKFNCSACYDSNSGPGSPGSLKLPADKQDGSKCPPKGGCISRKTQRIGSPTSPIKSAKNRRTPPKVRISKNSPSHRKSPPRDRGCDDFQPCLPRSPPRGSSRSPSRPRKSTTSGYPSDSRDQSCPPLLTFSPPPITVNPPPITVCPSPITVTPSPITVCPSPIKITPPPITVCPPSITIRAPPRSASSPPRPVSAPPRPVSAPPRPAIAPPRPPRAPPKPVYAPPRPVCAPPKPVSPHPKLDCPPTQRCLPCTEKLTAPPSLPSDSEPKPKGISLKMMPSKKLSSSQNSPTEYDIVKLNSTEKLTIKLKDCCVGKEENVNIKVTDEDGRTLYERKDYVCGQSSSLLQDLYRDSNINRVSTPILATDLTSQSDKQIFSKLHSDQKLDDAIEIQFKLRIIQGDKTTEIDIEKDDNEQNKPNTECKSSGYEPKVYNVKRNAGDSMENLKVPKDVISIKIILNNHKAKPEKPKDKITHYKDFPKEVSEKFHTVSTGYSDTYHSPIHSDNQSIVDKADIPSLLSSSQEHTDLIINKIVKKLSDKGFEKLTDTKFEKLCDKEFGKFNDKEPEKQEKSPTNSKVCLSVHSIMSIAVKSNEETKIVVTENESSKVEKTLQNEANDYCKTNETKSKISFAVTSDQEIEKITQNSDTPHETITKTALSDTNDHITFKKTTKPKCYDTEEEANAKIPLSVTNNQFACGQSLKPTFDDTEETIAETSLSDTNDHLTSKQTTNSKCYDTQDKAKVKIPSNDTNDHFISQETTKIDTLVDPSETKHTITQSGETKMVSSPSKENSRIEKKELLKKVFQKAHDRPKNKDRVRQLREMLKIILTDSSEIEDPMLTVTSNELAKDVTYTSLKPNYFRDTDSMNNYYRIESGSSKFTDTDSSVKPEFHTDSDTDEKSYISINKSLPSPNGCLCSKVVQKINIPNIGCCCKKKTKQDNEINCNLYDELYTEEYTDAMTQNSVHYDYKTKILSEERVAEKENTVRISDSNLFAMNSSIKNTSENKVLIINRSMNTNDNKLFTMDKSMKTSENKVFTIDKSAKTSENKVDTKDNSMKTSEIITKDNTMETSKDTIITKDKSVKTSEESVIAKEHTSTRDEEKIVKKEGTKASRLKGLFSCKNNKGNMNKFRHLTEANENKTVVMNQDEEKHHNTRFQSADILQCYETKKAVLEIYAEKTFSENGEHLVAKLPKFIEENDSEIERHFKKISSQSYRSVCTKNIFYMSVGR